MLSSIRFSGAGIGLKTVGFVRTFVSTTPVNHAFKINLKPNEKKPIVIKQVQESDAPLDARKKINPRFSKRFQSSSIYDPFDFSLSRIHLDRKFNVKNNPANALFQVFGINPLDLYSSPDILSKFLSSTGRILHRDVTGLSAKNQRRLSKAIRRCQAIGLISKTHRDVSFLPNRNGGKV